MSKIKFVILILGASLWIGGTSIGFAPISSLGEMFTYKTGMLSLKLPDEGQINIKTESPYHPEIHVDAVGVPHIFGDSKAELAFGVGYMQARERYFQMELIIRTIKGQLSEVLGSEVLSSDTWWRPYEFDRKGRELLEEVKTSNPDIYEYLLAYSEGVREYLAGESEKERCPEYRVFDMEPMNWEPHYALLVLWYMSQHLSYGDYHLVRQDQINKLPQDQLEQFFPMTDPNSPLIIPDSLVAEESSLSLQRSHLSITEPIDRMIQEKENRQGVGSNNWVVHGSKTSNGAPILCNDPHLLLTLPSIFYEVHLVLKDQNIYGFTLASSPFIVIGHNMDIAWGITNGEWDLTDRTLLEVDVKNPTRYRTGGEWIEFEKSTYELGVRGQAPKKIEQLYSKFGKVIHEKDGNYYAQKWYPEKKHKSFITFIRFMDAQNWKDFKSALQHYEYPPQNFAYEDREGNIGIVSAGRMPIKKEGYSGGLTDTINAEGGFIAFEEWPSAYNPARGFLFSANQEPIQNGNYYNYGWMENNYRARRIHEFLSSKDTFSMMDMTNLLKDNKDLGALELRTLLEEKFEGNSDHPIIQKLINYDGHVDGATNEALIFKYFSQGMVLEFRQLLKKYWNLDQRPSFPAALQYLQKTDPMVFQDTTFSVKDFMISIADGTDRFLRSAFGKEYAAVPYGEVGDFNIPHIARLPGLGAEVKTFDGNRHTVNVNGSAHASLRFVVSFGEGDAIDSKVIVAGGQSGRINSPNYKDQLEKWLKNEYRTPQLTTDRMALQDIKTSIRFEK